MINYNEILELAKQKSIEDIELFNKETSTKELKLFKSEITSTTLSNINVLSIRGIFENKMGNVYLEKFDKQSVNNALDLLILNAKTITSNEVELINKNENIKSFSCEKQSYTITELTNIMKTLEKIVYNKSNLISTVEVSMHEEYSKTTIVNSKEMKVSKDTYNIFLVCDVFALDNQHRSSSFKFEVRRDLDFDLDLIASEVVDYAISMLSATSTKSGKYQTILNSKVASILLSSLFTHFSADSVHKGRSVFVDQLETKVMSEKINLIDDPTIINSIGFNLFDDELSNTQKTVVVENGVLKSFLHNASTATKDKLTSTGNGFRNNEKSPISINPTNFYIKPGDSSEEVLIEKVRNGIIITEVSGQHAGINVFTGDFSLQCKGFSIENGLKSKAVNLITVSGNFFDVLKNVSDIGNNIKFSNSRINSPSLVVGMLQISGSK